MPAPVPIDEDPIAHAPYEDALALITGTILVALSVQFLRAEDLITGQTAGLALVVSYAAGIGFGPVFFALNLPFYWFAFRRMGMAFSLKTFAAVALISGLSELLHATLTIDVGYPAIAAVLAGVTAGPGLLAIFRHNASLGGVGIIALYLQDHFAIRAGRTQLLFDVGVFALALALFPWQTVLWSLLGAVVLNVIIILNHRRDRYVAR